MVNNYRFIKEYANYCKRCLINNDLMDENIKKERIENIDKYMAFCRRGLITVNECMLAISKQ